MEGRTVAVTGCHMDLVVSAPAIVHPESLGFGKSEPSEPSKHPEQ
jgi:hypothetical protein